MSDWDVLRVQEGFAAAQEIVTLRLLGESHAAIAATNAVEDTRAAIACLSGVASIALGWLAFEQGREPLECWQEMAALLADATGGLE